MNRDIKYWLCTLLGVAGIITGVSFVVRRCDNCGVENERISYKSRYTSSLPFSSAKIGYTRVRDGSQEVSLWGIEFNTAKLLQDLDGDDKVDRIRVEYYLAGTRDLEDVLIRKLDYNSNREVSDEADRLLLQERENASK